MIEADALWLVPGLTHPVFSRYATFFRSIFRRFDALDYREAYLNGGRKVLEQRVEGAIKAAKPQLIIYTQFPSSYSYLAPTFVGALRERGRVVALGFDDEIYFEQSKFFYAQCDAVITTDIPGAERLRAAGIPAHLAQLQQPHVSAQANGTAEDIAVSFIGDMSKPGRRQFVRVLEAAGVPVADYGAGSRNGRLSDPEVLDVFRRSRINLNFTRTNPPAWILRHDPGRARAGQIKGRPFELAALRKFCLCEWAPCVDYWFRPGVEIGVFRSADDLVSAAKEYLDNDVLRRKLAAAAHDRYRLEYAPEVQFTRIFLSILADAGTHRPATPVADAIFHESMGRSRGVAFLHAIRRAAPLMALREISAEKPSNLDYWRGFAGGVTDTISQQIRQPR